MLRILLTAALVCAAAGEALALSVPATIDKRLRQANGIYASGPLADQPITLVWDEIHAFHDPDLADVTGGIEMREIQETVGAELGWVYRESVTAFFVDSLRWPDTQPAGAANGYGMFADIDWAMDPRYGAELVAHELAHSLGLGHHQSRSNLMYWQLSGGTALTAGQAATMLSSPLLRMTDLGWTLRVIPVWISSHPIPGAAAVPVPAAGLLALTAFLPLAALARRRSRRPRAA